MAAETRGGAERATMLPDRGRGTATSEVEDRFLITRREAIRRVSLMLGGVALVGGDALLTGCSDFRMGARADPATFSADDIAYLDEVADTILPETGTPGAKAAGVGAFMALMVADTYEPEEQTALREGMRRLEDACREMNDVGFMAATPAQRLALLERIDQEQWRYMEARSAARDRRARAAEEAAEGAEADAYLPDQRQENAPEAADASNVPAITADAPVHYFRMIKELTLLGYFTSEIGATQAMRYVESPGRFDPCVPYSPGDRAWAPHA